MAIAFQFLGMSPMGRNGVPAMDSHKDDVAFECGKMVMDLLKKDIRPETDHHAPLDRKCHCRRRTTGGSTNAVLHLLAVAREMGVRLTIDDFDKINRKVPLLADLKPGGHFTAADLYAAGGTTLGGETPDRCQDPHPDQITVSGRTIGEEAKAATKNRPAGVAPAVQADQADWRPGYPEGQPGA